MEYMLAQILLPMLLPMITAMLKKAIDTAVPQFAARVPKPIWPIVVTALSGVATWLKPELFLIPGQPAVVSTALYTTAAMGFREVLDQVQKATGLKEQSTTIYGISQSESGTQILTPKV